MSEPLYESYRPRSFADVLGQDKIVRRLQIMRERAGLSGRAYWLAGPSGAGKTTIARLIAGEVADEWTIEELDASAITVSGLRDLERSLQTRGFGKGGRAVIVNEAHGLRRDVVRQLLVMLERIPSHVVWVFTTTIEGQDSLFEGIEDSHPLLSRCVELPLARRGLADVFAQRAKEIAESEGLDGAPLTKYKRLVQDKRNNLRAVLQAVGSGEMLAD